MITHVAFHSTKDCIYAKISGDEKNIFSGFLGDSGGSGISHLIILFSDLLQKLKSLESKFDFGTNSWIATVTKDETTIFFALDDDYYFKIETRKFMEIVSKWLDFIKQIDGNFFDVSFEID